MPDPTSSRVRTLPAALVSLLGLGFLVSLAGCTGAPVSSARLPGTPGVGSTYCSLRATVNLRPGSSIRSESDLVDVARRLGITISVLQSMGRDTKMIAIRENGPAEVCEDALAALRDDLRIESIERR